MQLIDKNELIKNLLKLSFYPALVNLAIVKTPTIELVRCKECKYWQDNNGGYPHEECRWGKEETPDADDFCSYGEKKEDNNEQTTTN